MPLQSLQQACTRRIQLASHHGRQPHRYSSELGIVQSSTKANKVSLGGVLELAAVAEEDSGSRDTKDNTARNDYI